MDVAVWSRPFLFLYELYCSTLPYIIYSKVRSVNIELLLLYNLFVENKFYEVFT